MERVKEVEAFAPSYPFPREERWYFLLCEASKNLLMAHDVAVLLEAEKAGAAQPELANGLPEAPAKVPMGATLPRAVTLSCPKQRLRYIIVPCKN